MKGILYSICIGSLALALTAQGEEVKGGANARVNAKARHTSNVHATTSANTAAAVSSPRSRGNVAGTRFHQRSSVTPQTRTRATVNRNNATTSANRPATVSSPRSRGNVAGTRFHQPSSVTAQTGPRATVNRNNMPTNRVRALNERERNVTVNRNANLRNRISFSQAVSLHRHEFHNRDFWRRHFQIVIINNNAFFFDAGFWFPAWGYFPGAYYPYDGPIYGYNGLTPDQVVVNVQLQLQRDGYYAGPIDGVLGPMTRHSIAAFQADHGLAVTAAIDQITVSTLGLT